MTNKTNKPINKKPQTRSKSKTNKGWRPTVMNEYTIGKLEEAFAMWCTIVESCLYANINPDTYYEYLKKNPKYSERFEQLRETPVLLARQTVIKYIQWEKDEETKKYIITPNPDIAMKYLERKKKDEFSLRTETTGKDWAPIEVLNKIQSLPTEELLKMLKQQ